MRKCVRPSAHPPARPLSQTGARARGLIWIRMFGLGAGEWTQMHVHTYMHNYAYIMKPYQNANKDGTRCELLW